MAGLIFNRIRLVGFKSFVDPTDFLIEPGLTGIVGPNGCGKSNLLEAIRWVMGANSAKAMRAAGMNDVIFNGTKTRPGRNQAHVTLFIDNSARVAPSALNDEDALEVTRILTAGKGSIYKVNGRTVRARDVQLLFADASTGANSPALVRQGQISGLIAAKPSNRRRILEEAAGISGLHTRRHEAELRLRAAEANLERLDDIIAQIESQLASLRHQSRQAARYKRLAGEIHEYKALLWLKRWQNALENLAESEVDVQTHENAVTNTARAAAELTARVAKLASELTPKREQQLISAAVLARLHAAHEVLEADEAKARTDIQRLADDMAQITRDIDRETDILTDSARALERLNSEKASLSGRDDPGNAIAAARAAADEAVARRSSLEADYNELTCHMADHAARRGSAARDLERISARLLRLESDRNALRTKLDKLQQDRPDDSGDFFEASLNEARDALDAVRQSEAELQNRMDTAETREQSTRDVLAGARTALDRLTAEQDALAQVVLPRQADGESDPVLGQLNVTCGYEVALAVALGDDLNAPIGKTSDMHWGGAGKPTQLLPDGAVPLSDFVTAPDELAARLSQVGVVGTDKMAALEPDLKPGQRLVCTNGHLIRWDGFEIRSGAETSAAVRLKQQNRLDDLRAGIDVQSRRVEAAQTEFEAAQAACKILCGELETLRSKTLALEKTAREARDSLARLETETVQFEAGCRTVTERMTHIEADMSELTGQKKFFEAGLAQIEDGPDFTARQAELSTKLAAARSTANETGAHYRSLVSQAQSRRTRLENITSEMADWDKRQSLAASRLENLQTRFTRTKIAHTQAISGPDQFKVRRDKLFAELENAENRRNKAADDLSDLENRIKALETQAREIEQAHSTAREDRAVSEARLTAARERVEDIHARIIETLFVGPEKLTGLLGEKRADSGLTEPDIGKKLDRLQSWRERMGAVNLRADAEIAEQEEHLAAMGDERADLVAAIAQLREGIDTLNSEGRQRLLEAFDVVNGHFRRLFHTLFGGGEAALALTESDDPLEAGLEIMVNPPGKKPGSMSLLSGGEQALTATALIFAVFLSNPAPICVLDEVDAPLDDTNVSRYCDLLDAMTKQTHTRFITITHNAVTMSRMDRLFGITMAEPGVSQLLSMELSRATRLVAAE